MATINSHTDQNGKTTYKGRVRVKGHAQHTKTFNTKREWRSCRTS